MNKEINTTELDFLLRYPAQPGLTSPVDFLSNQSWGGIKVSVVLSAVLPPTSMSLLCIIHVPGLLSTCLSPLVTLKDV